MSVKTFLSFLAFLLLATPMLGRDKPEYAVSKIPKTLLSGANAVLRTKEVVFERKSPNHAHQEIHYVVTVLNKAGYRNGIFMQVYNSFSSISQIRGTVYDKNGKKVKTLKQDDIVDAVADLGAALYTDARLKYIDPDYDNYPYTVEYSCRIDYNSLLNIPSWHVYESYKLAIQQEHFELIAYDNNNPGSPLGIKIHPNNKNIVITKKTILGKDAKNTATHYTYNVSNLKAIQREIYSKPLSQITPVVYFAPAKFVVAGYEGSFNSWNDFGNFIRLLNKDRDALPVETQTKIDQLTASDSTTREKVETLYNYMQNKVHYINIAKGIQGWQPMPAEKVDALNYGDCKALTNYMKSLLKAAGIPSYYTLVHAGANAPDILPDFPSNQFNHAILCVPLKKDTLWLECTSQYVPCGYIGDFTDDRHVLVIADYNAFLTRTPRYGEKQNVRSRKTDVAIQPDGTCNMHITSSYTGMFYDENLSYMLVNDKKKKQALLRSLHLPTIQLNDFHFSSDKNHMWHNQPLPVIHADIKITAAHYATTIGNYFILRLFPFSGSSRANARFHRRQFDIYIPRSYAVVDTLVFHVPKQMKVSKIPAAKTITTKFGTYSFSVKKEDDKIVYVRKVTVNKGDYPPSDFEAFDSFLEQKANMDNVKMVLSL